MIFEFRDNETGNPLASWELNPSQARFINSKKKFVLFSGGYGCGKSLVLTLKAVELSVKYPGNFILMGRRTYPELRDTLIKEFFNYCPDELIKDYLKAEGRVIFNNKSEIVFRHLDTMAESEIRSMNLGSAFIDQAEDISRDVVMGLRGRLRRDSVADGDRRIYLSCNPALTWLFSEFKQNPQPEYEVIEASTLENRANLPKEYVDDLLKYPEKYKQQYVYGVWDESLLSDNIVFDPDYQKRIRSMIRSPLSNKNGLDIFCEFVPGHEYQIGVDPIEGGEGNEDRKDFASVTIADLTVEEEVAAWSGKVSPDVLADKVVKFAMIYSDERNSILIVPEMNASGLAFLNKLREIISNDSLDNRIRIYKREEFDSTRNKKLTRYGWRTTRHTKPLLVNRFQDLLRLRNPKVYSLKKAEQFKSFVYTDAVKKMGMGAKEGFYDDELISLFLAFWKKGEVVQASFSGESVKPKLMKESILKIKKGKAVIVGPRPELEINRSWKVL